MAAVGTAVGMAAVAAAGIAVAVDKALAGTAAVADMAVVGTADKVVAGKFAGTAVAVDKVVVGKFAADLAVAGLAVAVGMALAVQLDFHISCRTFQFHSVDYRKLDRTLRNHPQYISYRVFLWHFTELSLGKILPFE